MVLMFDPLSGCTRVWGVGTWHTQARHTRQTARSIGLLAMLQPDAGVRVLGEARLPSPRHWAAIWAPHFRLLCFTHRALSRASHALWKAAMVEMQEVDLPWWSWEHDQASRVFSEKAACTCA